MDFFQQQEKAKQKTLRLVFYFIVCIFFIIGAICLATIFILSLSGSGPARVEPAIFILVSLCVILIVLLGTLYKLGQLKKGGVKVAELLGGKRIDSGTKDPKERQLLNVVEEMAVASGISPPPVYLLNDESGINAFAAGFAPTDAVIGVTKGALIQLNRDELQGVIGHEFSHIFNGDMRLNIRLMGVLHGLLVITIIGRILIRTRGRKNPLPLLGLAFIIIGFIGVLFGRLIKAAVSRQREFLADAASVQFTRNPQGIGGALKKIGSMSFGSKLGNSKAEEASHFFFANGLKKSFIGLFSTHPDLQERIKRIDPSFDGNIKTETAKQIVDDSLKGTVQGMSPLAQKTTVSITPEAAVERVGQLINENLSQAAAVIKKIPEKVHDPDGAQALVYLLLINTASDVKRVQLAHLEKYTSPSIFELINKNGDRIKNLGRQNYLPLIDVALCSLKGLSINQYNIFRQNVQFLIEADNKIDLFEFVLETSVIKHLDVYFKKIGRPQNKYSSLERLKNECIYLLSTLAHYGNPELPKAAQAFAAAKGRLFSNGEYCELLPREKIDFRRLSKVLQELELVKPQLMKSVLEATVAAVSADQKITLEEFELVRGISDALGCPMPPITLN